MPAQLTSDVRRRIADALSEDRHRLLRADHASVACICGLYISPESGPRNGTRWRAHLIEAALAAFDGQEGDTGS